jgi:hypothetical protein
MKNARFYVIAFVAVTVTGTLVAETEDEPLDLYQIGQDGVYCVSLTQSKKDCISGADEHGNPVNRLDVLKGRAVVFHNLSDAPHDMNFTGANAEDVPDQAPNGSAVSKVMRITDPSTQKITCSYHGDQLGLGYRVPDGGPAEEEQMSGHKKPPAGGMGDPGPDRQLVPTGLADVSEYIIKKGSKGDVGRLLARRPDLEDKIQQFRPDLALDLFMGKGGKLGGFVDAKGNLNLGVGGLSASASMPSGTRGLKPGFALYKNTLASAQNAFDSGVRGIDGAGGANGEVKINVIGARGMGPMASAGTPLKKEKALTAFDAPPGRGIASTKEDYRTLSPTTWNLHGKQPKNLLIQADASGGRGAWLAALAGGSFLLFLLMRRRKASPGAKLPQTALGSRPLPGGRPEA